MLGNEGYRYTFIILNVDGFSTATIVMRMHLSVMCIHVLCGWLYMSAALILARLIVMLLSYYTLTSDKEKNV